MKILNNFKSLLLSVMLRFVAFMICVLLLAKCGNNRSGESQKNDAAGSSPDVDVVVPKLTEEKAIAVVQQYIVDHPKDVTVKESYTDWEMKDVPCGQYDKDAGTRCSEPRIGAPYGYKRVSKPYTRCCRDKKIRLKKFSGQWKAVNQDQEWMIELALNEVQKVIKWVVGDETGQVRTMD